MENLRSLEIFLAVAETLSFAEAARRLDLSPSAAGKAVGTLETRLCVRLFNRTTRRVSLTPEGELLLGRARRLQEDWRETEAILFASAAEPQGLLRISLPTVGYRILAPHLAEFARAYPKVRLDLDFDDRIKDLVAEGFDVAIRSGVLPNSTLMSRKLISFSFVLCAAPAYLDKFGVPRDLGDLAVHSIIRFRHPGTDVLQPWQLASGTAHELDRKVPTIVCTNMEAVREASLAGLGIAWVPDFLIADTLETGELVSVLRSEMVAGMFWLLWPPGKHSSPRLRAFLDFTARHLDDRNS